MVRTIVFCPIHNFPLISFNTLRIDLKVEADVSIFVAFAILSFSITFTIHMSIYAVAYIKLCFLSLFINSVSFVYHNQNTPTIIPNPIPKRKPPMVSIILLNNSSLIFIFLFCTVCTVFFTVVSIYEGFFITDYTSSFKRIQIHILSLKYR